MPIYTSLIVPTDGSPASELAIDVACSMLAPKGHLTIVHVDPSHVLLVGRHVETGAATSEERRAGVAAIRRACERAEQAGVDSVHIETRTGDAADEILSVAEAAGADAIVMGSRRRSALERALLGSVATAVVHRTSVPVVVVHEPAER